MLLAKLIILLKNFNNQLFMLHNIIHILITLNYVNYVIIIIYNYNIDIFAIAQIYRSN